MKRIFAITLALAGFCAVVHAAPEDRRAARQDAIREKLRTVRIARLIEALDLDTAGAARLMPVLDRGYDEISAVSRQSGAARRELRALVVAERPDDARVNQLVDQLLGNRARIENLQQEMVRGVRKVLTPKQAGRLVLVLPEIERQLQQQIRRAARGGLNKPGFAPDSFDSDDETPDTR